MPKGAMSSMFEVEFVRKACVGGSFCLLQMHVETTQLVCDRAHDREGGSKFGLGRPCMQTKTNDAAGSDKQQFTSTKNRDEGKAELQRLRNKDTHSPKPESWWSAVPWSTRAQCNASREVAPHACRLARGCMRNAHGRPSTIDILSATSSMRPTDSSRITFTGRLSMASRHR